MMEWTQKRAGLYGVFVHTAFAVMDTAIEGVDSRHMAFTAAWSVVRSMSAQAFLAAMRQHRIQMTLCLRQVLEGISLFAYLMGNPHPDDSPINRPDGTMIDPGDLMKRRVYPWMKEEFPVASDHIKELKDHINRMTGHANLIQTASIFDYEQTGPTISADFFDRPDEHMVWANFYEVGEAISLAINVLVDANIRFNGCRLRRTFLIDLQRLSDLHDEATADFNRRYPRR